MKKTSIDIPMRVFSIILMFITCSTIPQTTRAQQLSIVSFSPASAQAGSFITITGTGFSKTPADNIVFIGTVRASVVASTETTLVVLVPLNAPNERIQVGVNGHVAISHNNFSLLFAGSTAISSTSYLTGNSFTLAGSSTQYDHRASWGDLDNDGLIEFVCSDPMNTYLCLARNTSTPGNISFAPVQNVNTVFSFVTTSILSDLDRDGRLDIIAEGEVAWANSEKHKIHIYRNNSTPGNISFPASAKTSINSNGAYGLAVADMNGDGLPDLVASNMVTLHTTNQTGGSNAIMVYLNTSTGPGHISFSSELSFLCPFKPYDISVRDFDLDGKPDVAFLGISMVALFRNLTPNGDRRISFAKADSIITTGITGVQSFKTCDLNSDDKPEIVVATYDNSVKVFENLSVPGSLSFALPLSLVYTTGSSLSIEDLNGDGFNDLVVSRNQTVNVFPNAGIPGTITSASFLPRVNISAGSTNSNFNYIVDIDNDGRKDLIVRQTGTQYYIKRFDHSCLSPYIVTQLPSSIISCVGTPASFSISAAGTGTLTYQWYKDGLPISGATSSSYTIPSVNPTHNGIYTVSVSDHCTITSNAAIAHSSPCKLTVPSSYATWTGAISNNWFTAGNWACNITPTSTTSILIPSAAPNMPEINGGSADVLNLEIASGASLSVTNSGILDIYGTFVNYGTFISTASSVNFKSTTSEILIPKGKYSRITLPVNIRGAKLTGNIVVKDSFHFNGDCILRLDFCNLTLLNYTKGAVTGAGTNSYFSTNKAGRVRFGPIGSASPLGDSAFLYVGNSTYNPANIKCSGILDTFSISIADSVYKYIAGYLVVGPTFTSNVVNRTWVIGESNLINTSYQITPWWQSAHELTGFNNSSCYTSAYIVPAWIKGTTGPATVNGSYYSKTHAYVNYRTQISVGSNGTLFPVDLFHFSAARHQKDVHVKWSTASEVNNNYFEPEVSVDGKTFTSLGRVQGKGNSSSVNHYNYHHINAVALANQNKTQTLYYRLKQVDFSGAINYSDIVPVNLDIRLLQVSVSPNPFNNETSLHMTTPANTEAEIRITDIHARQLGNYTHQLTEGDNHINLKGIEVLSPGIYFITVITRAGEVQTLKIVKQ